MYGTDPPEGVDREVVDDPAEVPEVRHPERGGRGHEDLPRQGRGQCGNGALLLLLVRKQ